jgi:predicted nuclease with TOPRIM domain
METPNQPAAPIARTAVMLLLIALCGIAGISMFYFVREHRQSQQLATSNQALTANLNQVQGQLQALTDKLNALSAAQPAPAERSVSATVNEPASTRPSAMGVRVHKKPVHRTVARKPPADDPRWSQVQGQLTEQQKQLASTREDLEKSRAEMDGRLNSTRDELNGSITHTRDELNSSIARTHDEVVLLQKRGERNYYEFHLDKSKAFQRVGPISVSLRKVNLKHKNYNLALMVDDNQLDKKNVNMLEPVWITLSDRPQPVELVVNQVRKDQISGYLSEPKYRKSELAASATTASAAPAADKGAQQ